MAATIDSARQLFKRHFNGQPNLMTPGILGYGWAGRLAWELSTGEGIRLRNVHGDGVVPALYAVTVLETSGAGTPAIRREDLSQCFTDADAREQANAYIRNLIARTPKDV